MSPLPTAAPETTRFFHQWLETFAGFVREVDYASARALFTRTCSPSARATTLFLVPFSEVRETSQRPLTRTSESKGH